MTSNSYPEILINKLFAGSYLDEGENIGHEIINLFQADDGNNYLYITPSGFVDLKVHPVSRVLFVRNLVGKTTVEVIAKAEQLTPVAREAAENLTYAGVPLRRIFRNNIYHGAASDPTSAHASFRAGKFRTPRANMRLILTIDPDFQDDDPSSVVIYFHSTSKAIDNQSARKYYSSTSDPEAYRALAAVLGNNDFWELQNTTTKLTTDYGQRASGPTFLEIIRKENDELTFSNLLAYYFQYDALSFQKLAREVLGLTAFGRNFEIIRERNNNIDLWIESAEDIIVIENKIKSSLNGVKSDHYSQLNKYQDYTEERISDPEDDVCGKVAHYYIFTPDYNLFDIAKYQLEKPYRVVKYSEIYQFFYRHAARYVADRYFADFLKGLHNHTMSISELNFSIMRSRFIEQVHRAK